MSQPREVQIDVAIVVKDIAHKPLAGAQGQLVLPDVVLKCTKVFRIHIIWLVKHTLFFQCQSNAHLIRAETETLRVIGVGFRIENNRNVGRLAQSLALLRCAALLLVAIGSGVAAHGNHHGQRCLHDTAPEVFAFRANAIR